EVAPYPTLRVVVGSEQIEAGRTIMLSGAGKFGLMARGEELDGRMVVASGVLLTRGDLDMLQVRGGANGVSAADEPQLAAVTLEAPAPLGRWRLSGEMCDGKCLAGAMRPGRGLAHKACANLCVVGGVPPVFVSAAPVEGEEFFMLAGPGGTELDRDVLDHMAAYVTLEGDLERRGDLIVLTVDPATIEPL
ncbi:MAG: hypothetical protein AAF322_17470, partial [Pseudomonadota bacterium]